MNWVKRLKAGESLSSIQESYKKRSRGDLTESDVEDMSNMFGEMSNKDLKKAYRQLEQQGQQGGPGYESGGTPSGTLHQRALMQNEMEKRGIEY